MKVLPLNPSDKKTTNKSWASPLKKARKRVLTEPEEKLQSVKYSFQSDKKLMIPLIKKSEHFSSIFTRRKRNQYSGYKQNNLNKSKLIEFQKESSQQQIKKPTRIYETNSKNIARLRRRFSCEPQSKLFECIQNQYKLFSDQNMRSAFVTQYSEVHDQSHIKIRQILKKMIDLHQPLGHPPLPQITEEHKRQKTEIESEFESNNFQKYEYHSERLKVGREKMTNQSEIKKTLRQKKIDLREEIKKKKEIIQANLASINKNISSECPQQKDTEGIELSAWQHDTPETFKPKPSFFDQKVKGLQK